MGVSGALALKNREEYRGCIVRMNPGARYEMRTAVDVNAITYADGSNWRTSSPGACSASPDLFMLVNAER